MIYRSIRPHKQNQTFSRRSLQLVAISMLVGGIILGRMSVTEPEIMSGNEYIMITYPGFLRLTDQTIENKALDFINAANYEIYMNGFGFTSKPIAEALINASKRGVKIYLLLDKSNEHTKHSIIHQLQEYINNHKPSNFEIYIRDISGIHHAKVLVADDASILGSYNWSKSAKTVNDEIVSVKPNDRERVKELKKAWHQWKSQKSHLFQSAYEENEGQPWTLKYDKPKKIKKSFPANNPFINKASEVSNMVMQEMNTLSKTLQNETKEDFKEEKKIFNNEMRYIVEQTILERIKKSKTYCYLQVQKLDYDTGIMLVELKKRNVEVLVYAASMPQYQQTLLQNADIMYHIDPKIDQYSTKVVCINDTANSEALYIVDNDTKYLYIIDHIKQISAIIRRRGSNESTRVSNSIKNSPVSKVINSTREVMKNYRSETY